MSTKTHHIQPPEPKRKPKRSLLSFCCLLGKLAHTSVGVNVRNNGGSGRGRGNVLAREVAEEAGVAGAEGARVAEGVDDTAASEVGLARGAG